MNMNERNLFLKDNYLLNIDSTLGLKSIPDRHVSLVLTDPPYGIADKAKLTKSKGKIVSTNDAWGKDFQDAWASIDDYYAWLSPFVTQLVRVMKDDASLILFLDRKYTGLITHYLERDFDLNFKNKIYFKKLNPMPGIRKTNYRSSIEEAVWFTKGKQFTFNFGPQSDMTQCYEGAIGRKFTEHPTEKYRWMIDPLIRNHSKAGDIVLDCFAGSGSTLLYAREQERMAIGFEKNPAFYEMAKKRLEAAQLSFAFM